MNFAPQTPDRVLHDTWAYVHAGTVHLFYLAISTADPTHRLIGHATSSDWLAWSEQPFIDLAGPEGAWDSGRIGTGHVFRGADKRFYMAYTGRVDPEEAVGLAVSDDLMNWHKLMDRPVWARQQTRGYERDADRGGMPPAWRDPYVFIGPDGERYALLCARTSTDCPPVRGCVAVARLDECSQWTTLSPMCTGAGFPIMEVPEAFVFHGRWRLTFNTHSGWGRRLDSVSRDYCGGTFWLESDNPFGPWTRPEENLLIGSGGGRRDAVVARSVPWKDHRVVYHHYTGSLDASSPRAFGLPKVLGTKNDRLVLNPWPSLDRLWCKPCAPASWEAPPQLACAGGQWRQAGSVLHGQVSAGAALRLAAGAVPDVDVEMTLRLDDAPRAGLLWGCDETGRGGVLLLCDAARQRLTLGRCSAGPYGPLLEDAMDSVRWPVPRRRDIRLRMIRRSCYVDAFVDDLLCFCTIVGGCGSGPCVGVVLDSGSGTFQIVRCHSISPMGD